MRIVNLRAENLKRLVAVDITPDEHAVVISGQNGAGKTSVLDAIWFALGGGRAQADTPHPVRDGAEGAEVRLDLGDLYVTRKWKADGTSTLRVAGNDGAAFKSPQAMLDGLLGRLSFDPLAFAQAAPKDQLATLLDLVELPFDPAKLDAQRAGVFERRTDVNREAKALQARYDGMPAITDPGLPDREVSAVDVLGELQQAQAVHAQHADAQRERARLEAEVDRFVEALSKAEDDLIAAQRVVEALGDDVPDLDAIQARLSGLEEINTKVRAMAARDVVADQLVATKDRAEVLTEELAAIDDTKAKAIAAARMPIDGLGFDPDGVTYQGVPFSQCSGAEKLRVSLAMAMALNPEIRVVRITDASLLDDNGMRLVTEMAVEHDFQIWLERVGTGDPMGIVIDDGMVAGAAPVEPLVEAF